jgi:hypothetical protein
MKKVITGAVIEDIRRKLENKPPVDPSLRQYAYAQAIDMLRPSIDSMRERGYSLDHISKELQGMGLEVSSKSLAGYLKQSAGPVAADADAAHAGTAVATRPPLVLRKFGEAGQGTDHATTSEASDGHAPPSAFHRKPVDQIDHSRASFEMRPDTDNI